MRDYTVAELRELLVSVDKYAIKEITGNKDIDLIHAQREQVICWVETEGTFHIFSRETKINLFMLYGELCNKIYDYIYPKGGKE